MSIALQINRGLLARAVGVCIALSLGLSACGDKREDEIKATKEEVQRAYGKKDFQKILSQAQKGLPLAIEVQGDKSPDALYFVQAITEANMGMRNMRGTMTALKRELEMRTAAGQTEKKLQPRRTLLIKLAEENGDPMTAAAQAVLVSKGIEMGAGKDPQPVYRTETQYPVEQYRKGIEGDVEIAYSLDSTGAITDAYVSKSTPPQVFDQAALDSFKKWRFTPMLDSTGQPKSASGFKFTLAFRMGK
jgi:TonB family protein